MAEGVPAQRVRSIRIAGGFHFPLTITPFSHIIDR